MFATNLNSLLVRNSTVATAHLPEVVVERRDRDAVCWDSCLEGSPTARGVRAQRVDQEELTCVSTRAYLALEFKNLAPTTLC